MDQTDSLSIERALLGIAVLQAIPVAIFALWAEYYQTYLKSARKSMPGYDPKLEKERIQIATACVLIFESVLWVGSLEFAGFYVKSAICYAIAVLFLVLRIEKGLESELQVPPLSATAAQRESGGTPTQKAFRQARTLALGVLSGFIFLGSFIIFARIGLWAAANFHLSPGWSAATVMFSVGLGILFGVATNFSLSPWQIKNSLPVSPMTETERNLVERQLNKAQLGSIETWILEDESATAAIAGFRFGSGPFKPGLFVSRKLFQRLSLSEVDATIAHEAAHILANHLLKRVVFSTAVVLSLTFLAVFSSMAAFLYFPQSEANGGVGLIAGAMSCFVGFFLIQKQSRVHEFQADWLAIHKLGADFESWASALRKLDEMNGYPLNGPLSTHPRTELRIQNVARMIEFFAVMKKAEAQESKKSATEGNDHAA